MDSESNLESGHEHGHRPVSTQRRLCLAAAGLILSRPTLAATGDGAGFIAAAFAERDRAIAAGDRPYGAVVVLDGEIVGRGPSRVILDRDPTAHAEMQAIRDACRHLGRADLSACILYASSRPCPMCEMAAYWAGVARFHYGAEGVDGGRPTYCR